MRLPAQVPIFAVLLVLAAWAIYHWQIDVRGDPEHLVVSGSMEGEDAYLGSKVGGRLLALYAHEGDSVTAGQLLAEFDVPELRAQREQMRGTLAEAQATQQKLVNGARPQELAQAAAVVAAAKAQLSELELGTREEDIAAAESAWRNAEAQAALAVADLKRAQELYDAAVVPRSQLDAAQARAQSTRQQADAARDQYDKALNGPRYTAIDAAKAQVKQAQAAYDLVRAGSRKEDLAAAAARVETINAQIAALDVSLGEARVLAPEAGVVLTVDHQPGDLLPPNTPVFDLLLPSSFYVQVFIPEQKLSWAQPGAEAVLAVDAYPGETFQGKVTFLSSSGEFTPRNLQTKEKRVEEVFRCKVKVEDPAGRLRPGMVCDVTFSRPAGVAPSGR